MAGQYRDLGDVSGAVAIDVSQGNAVRMRLVGAVVFTIVNMIDGEPLVLQVVQDGVGGRTINWNGGLQVANPPQPQADAASTTTFVLYGLDAQDQAAGTAIFVGGINASGSGGPAGLPVVGGWLTIANAVGAANGISLDALAGDSIRARINAATLFSVTPTGVNMFSPNTFNVMQIQDAGISLSHSLGYVDITGGGSPGITLNTTDTMAVSSANSALLRRSEDGLVRERNFVFPPVATTNATVTSVLEFATAAGFIYRVWAEIWVADDTNNTGGAFVPRMAAFQNIGGVLTQIETTKIIGPAGNLTDDCLGAALRAAPVAIVIDGSGTTIRVRVQGGAGINATWQGLVDIQPVAVV